MIIQPVIVLGMIGIILGVGLAIAQKHLLVVEDTRIDDIEKLLPNYNCGACGTPGCHAFAEAIVDGEVTQLSKCKPGKKDKHFDPIIEYLKDHPNEDGSIIKVKI
jgi:electron transport complex protein RnfB